MAKEKLWKVAVSVFVFCISLFFRVVQAEENLKSCYHEAALECPRYSLCSYLNTTKSLDLKCICLQHYEHNPQWQEVQDANNTNSTNSSSTFNTGNVVVDNYCIPSSSLEPEENKVIVYMRSAADPQHLVFGIILVLLAVTLVTAALYGLKVLRPVKRTKAAYKKLRNRRRNMTPLHEMDELELNRRYEMETY